MSNLRDIFRRPHKWKYIACLVLLCLFPAHSYFVVKNVNAYPWWHSFGNDIDAAYTGTTVGLLNDSELTLVAHPAATIYTLQGTVYRALSLFSPSHKRLLHLREVKSLDDASDILQTATQTGRMISFFSSIIFIILLFGIIHLMTCSLILAFLFVFYIITSEAFLFHIHIIRPEILNLLFFFAAFWVFLSSIKKDRFTLAGWARVFITVGFFLGFCVFSKIQIGPVLVTFMGVMIFYVFKRHKSKLVVETHPRNLRMCVFVSLVNFVLMPWWALKRPEFVTPQFLHDPRIVDDVRRIYGLGRESFIVPVVVILLCLTLLSGVLLILGQGRKKKGGIFKIFPIVSSLNFINLGVIISIYSVLLPVSQTLARYIENTNHLVYATITNVIYGGFLINRVLEFSTFEKINQMHWNQSSLHPFFFKINMLYFVAVATAVCFVRLCLQRTSERIPCLLTLCFFVTALIMDILATMRHHILFPYYAIYSISLYTLGLALWISLEFRDYSFNRAFHFMPVGKGAWFERVTLTLPAMIIILLVLHGTAVSRNYQFLRQPKSDGISKQDPFREYRNTRAHAAPFWKIVDESIRKQ